MAHRITARQRRRWLSNASFVLPFALVAAVFIAYPVVQAVLMSFYDWDLFGNTRDWLGLDNYTRMFGGEGIVWDVSSALVVRAGLVAVAVWYLIRSVRRQRLRSGEVLVVLTLVAIAVAMGFHPGEDGSWNDPRFWNALKNTVIFTLVSTPVIAGLGLGFALLLHRGRRLTGFYRAALFVPYVLPVSVATLIWGYLLNPSRGLVAWVTEHLGMGTVAWLSDPRFAMGAIVVTTVWWTVGFAMILFGAGLQDIDPTLYEAASLDGATGHQQFRHITLPGLSHATLLVMVTQVIASFQIFGQVNIMTSGGPGGATDVLVRYVYQTGFRDTELGYASAMSLFLFVVMAFVSLLQFLVSREKKVTR